MGRIKGLAHTGFDVGKVVAGHLGRAAVGVSKAAGAVAQDVAERRRTARRPAVPSPRTPPPAATTPPPPPAAPAEDASAAVTSDVDAAMDGGAATEAATEAATDAASGATTEAHDPSPADVARVVAGKPRSSRAAPKPARKRPAKKSVPGAKLPPRRPE